MEAGSYPLKSCSIQNISHAQMKLPLALLLEWSAGMLRLQANVALTSSMVWHGMPAAGPWTEHVSHYHHCHRSLLQNVLSLQQGFQFMLELFSAMPLARVFSETALCDAWFITLNAVIALGSTQRFHELLPHASLGAWWGQFLHSCWQGMQHLGCRQEGRVQVAGLRVGDGLP
jgi:hypothetical protein